MIVTLLDFIFSIIAVLTLWHKYSNTLNKNIHLSSLPAQHKTESIYEYLIKFLKICTHVTFLKKRIV